MTLCVQCCRKGIPGRRPQVTLPELCRCPMVMEAPAATTISSTCWPAARCSQMCCTASGMMRPSWQFVRSGRGDHLPGAGAPGVWHPKGWRPGRFFPGQPDHRTGIFHAQPARWFPASFNICGSGLRGCAAGAQRISLQNKGPAQKSCLQIKKHWFSLRDLPHSTL